MQIRKPFAIGLIVSLLVAAYLGFADLNVQHDKVVHFLVFFFITLVFYWVIDTSSLRQLRYITVISCTLVGGIGSELLQGFLPYRTFDVLDIVCNICGSIVALLLCQLYHRRMLQRKRQQRYLALHGGNSGRESGGLQSVGEPDVELGELDIETGPAEVSNGGELKASSSDLHSSSSSGALGASGAEESGNKST